MASATLPLSVDSPSGCSIPARNVWIALLVLALAGVGTTWIWWTGMAGGSVRSMPAKARLELYDRTMRDLVSQCAADRDPSLSDYCLQQAEFAMTFPECDAACTRIARRALEPDEPR
jgi:hypothetical protein